MAGIKPMLHSAIALQIIKEKSQESQIETCDGATPRILGSFTDQAKAGMVIIIL